jgi:hypothetical protein
LSPIVTAGLPAPGPPALLELVLLVEDAVELLDDELLPHAASPTTSALVANSIATPRPTDLLNRFSGISRLLICRLLVGLSPYIYKLFD